MLFWPVVAASVLSFSPVNAAPMSSCGTKLNRCLHGTKARTTLLKILPVTSLQNYYDRIKRGSSLAGK